MKTIRQDTPRVSVITAVYNGGLYLAESIDSVLTQDYPNIQLLVLDGGSTDNTIDVLHKYGNHIDYWASEPDNGVYDAWNKGLDKASGEWICFLGADDRFLPGAIRTYMDLATNNPGTEYLSSQVRWVHPSGQIRTIGEPWQWDRFSRFMCTAHVGSMHRHSLFQRLGTYDTSYRSAGDYELLLRARSELKAAYVPIQTVMMRAGGVSDSADALEEAMRAKIQSGGRNLPLAKMEWGIARAKLTIRSAKSRYFSRLKRSPGTCADPDNRA